MNVAVGPIQQIVTYNDINIDSCSLPGKQKSQENEIRSLAIQMQEKLCSGDRD